MGGRVKDRGADAAHQLVQRVDILAAPRRPCEMMKPGRSAVVLPRRALVPRLDDADRMEGIAIAVPVAAMIIIGRAAIAEKAVHGVVEGAGSPLVADRQVDVMDEPAHAHANAPISAKMPAPLSAGHAIWRPFV